MTEKQYKLPFEKYLTGVLDKMKVIAQNIKRVPSKQGLEEIAVLGEGVEQCYSAFRNAEDRYRKEAPGYVALELRPELQDESLRGSELMRRCHEYNKAHLPPEALEIPDFRNSLGPFLLAAADIAYEARTMLKTGELDAKAFDLGRDISRMYATIMDARSKPLLGIANLTDEQYNNGVRMIDEEFAKLKAGKEK